MTGLEDASILEAAIRDQINAASVSASADGLVVRLPDLRYGNGSIILSVERTDVGWTVSDVGHTASMFDETFKPMVDLYDCVGAPFDVSGRADGVVALTAEAESLAHAAELATSFAAHLSAAPLLSMARDCIRADSRLPKKLTASQHLARETRSRIVAEVPGAEPFVRLDATVYGSGEHVEVPLAIASWGGSGLPPKLISSFIDLTAPANAISAAKKALSFTVDVVHDYPAMQKFVVIRTDDVGEFEHLADFYDRDDTVAVRSDSPELLVEGAEEVVAQLVGA